MYLMLFALALLCDALVRNNTTHGLRMIGIEAHLAQADLVLTHLFDTVMYARTFCCHHCSDRHQH